MGEREFKKEGKDEGFEISIDFRNESNFPLPKGLSVILLNEKNTFISEFCLERDLHAGEQMLCIFEILKQKRGLGDQIHVMVNYHCDGNKIIYFSQIANKKVPVSWKR